MQEVLLFLVVFVVSFFGSLPFGMINMAVADLAIHRGLRVAVWFSAGAAFVEFFQGLIATKFSHIFAEKAGVSWYIQWAAVVIFFGLAIYYFLKQDKDPAVLPKRKYRIQDRWFWKGFGLSALNVLAYPFWVFMSTLLISNQLMNRQISHYIILSVALMMGAFCLFVLYAKFSVWLVKKNDRITPYLNKAFASFFLFLGLLQLTRILWNG